MIKIDESIPGGIRLGNAWRPNCFLLVIVLLWWTIVSSSDNRPAISLVFEIEGYTPYHLNVLLGDEIPYAAARYCEAAGCDSIVFTQRLLQSFQEHLDSRRDPTLPGIAKYPVNSYDIFDTLIARNVASPQDIFSLIEERYPFPRFRDLRVYAESQMSSDGTFDGIYHQFQLLTNMSHTDIIKLKEFELATEGIAAPLTHFTHISNLSTLRMYHLT